MPPPLTQLNTTHQLIHILTHQLPHTLNALSYIFGGVLFRMTDGWPAALWWFVCGALTCWALVSPILALCRRNAFDSIALLEARDE